MVLGGYVTSQVLGPSAGQNSHLPPHLPDGPGVGSPGMAVTGTGQELRAGS